MFSLYNIRVVAHYELLLLYRSWFFRVFALVVIGILGFFNVIFFSGVVQDAPWMLRGIPASVPYLNLILLNPIQAILCVFLASDFLKRDTKSSTVEVIYMRSISNAEYIVGKSLGVILVFVLFNLLILLVGGIVNGIFSDVPFPVMHYLYYFMLISVPTIIFAIGFSYILMTLFRNPPVTWVMMIGLVAVSLFYLKDTGLYIFDLVTFYLPLSWSDFTGFSDTTMVLRHRAIYLSLGLAFIFLTVLFMKRLPQSPWMNRISRVLFVLFGAIAVGLSTQYLLEVKTRTDLRAGIQETNKTYQDQKFVSVKTCNLKVEHKGNELAVMAEIGFTADQQTEYLFSLNPGFHIGTISLDGNPVEYERQYHLLKIPAPDQTATTGPHTLNIEYSGVPVDYSAYADLTKEEMAGMNTIALYKAGRRYAFTTPSYVLLTRENLWYPVAGTASGNLNCLFQQKFTRFDLTVKTMPGLQPISQGAMTQIADNEYHFIPETLLPQISLVIGDYALKQTIVDSIEYNLYTKKEHNYYETYFTDIGDTLNALIREKKNDLELKYNATFPFKRLTLVEVPLHYIVHARPLQFHYESVQPEQVFLIENGLKYDATDFKMAIHRQERFSSHSNRSFSKVETQAQLFNRFVEQLLTGEEGGGRWGNDGSDVSETANIFPNFYTYSNRVDSDEWPVLNKTVEALMYSKVVDEAPRMFRRFEGLIDEERANLLLADSSLSDIIKDNEQQDLWNHVLSVKSDVLFSIIKAQMGTEAFDDQFKDFLKSNRFESIKFTDFVDLLPADFQSGFHDYMQIWYNDNDLPAYYLTNATAFKVLDGNRTRYQIRFDIQNDQDVNGVVSISFRTGRGGFHGFGRPGGGDEEPNRIYQIAGNTAYRIGMVLDSEPRSMTVNTLTSRNLPIDIETRFEKLELNERAVPFDGIREIDLKELISADEIVVDNEDPGFSVESVQQASILKRLIGMENKPEDEYRGFNPWRMPKHWIKTVQSEFWGKSIHSAHVIRGSKSTTNIVKWNAEIKEPGHYNVYVYLNTSQLNMFRRRNRDMFRNLNYRVRHDDGIEPITIDIESAEEGWVLLGNYYLSAGNALVELSDKSDGRTVIADAVKWVKR